MTRMSRSLGRLISTTAIALLLFGCAQAKKSNQDSATTDSGSSGGGSTSPDPSRPLQPDPNKKFPALTKLQRDQALEVITSLIRMSNSLDQLYQPQKGAELDSVEQYVLETLQKYCSVASDHKENGNTVTNKYGLNGDACPMKSDRTIETTITDGSDSNIITNIGQDNYDVLAQEISSVIPLTKVTNTKSAYQKLTMPAKNLIQEIIQRSEKKEIVSTEYGTIPATFSMDLNALVIAIPDADGKHFTLGDYLQVKGDGVFYDFAFKDFNAELRIVYSKSDDNKEIKGTVTLNGETLNTQVLNIQGDLAKLSSGKILSLALSR